MKDVQVENVKNKLELRNFIHFHWKACESDANRARLSLGKEKS